MGVGRAASASSGLIASIAFSVAVGAGAATVQVVRLGKSLDSQMAIGAGFFTAVAVVIVVLPFVWVILAWSRRFPPRQALRVAILGLTAAAIVGLVVSQVAVGVLVVTETV